MRKITKPATKCECCGHTIEYAESEEFCDFCGKKIQPKVHLTITLFVGNDSSETLVFHSWKCVRDYLIKHKEEMLKVSFISLPHPIGEAHYNDSIDLMSSFFSDFLMESVVGRKE